MQLQIEIHLKDQVLHNLARVLYKLAEFGASVKCYQKIAALGSDHLISFRRTDVQLYHRATERQNSDLLQIFHPMTAILTTELEPVCCKKQQKSS